MTRTLALAAGLVLAGQTVLAADDHQHEARTTPPEGAMVYIISPQDGDTVTSPVTVQFGARGIGVAPAGVDWPNTGHHHLLINVDPSEIDFDAGVPGDERHRHFGGGQTEATVELEPGVHTLWLLMGDQYHVPHDPAVMSEIITITVE
jgi:hypothetical protein